MANIKGSFNLAGVSEYYPLEKGDELTGSFIFDIILKGKLICR